MMIGKAGHRIGGVQIFIRGGVFDVAEAVF